MPARPCLFVACAPSGSRIHPPYVKLFRKNCPAESTRIVERPKNQGPEQLPFTAIVTKNHPAGSTIRPSIWPTAVLLEGNDIAFDIKAVASPDPGSDLTVVIQT